MPATSPTPAPDRLAERLADRLGALGSVGAHIDLLDIGLRSSRAALSVRNVTE